MNNLKSAILVVLLLGALYGAYQFLNQRDVPPPPEAQLQFEQGIEPPTIEFGGPDVDFTATMPRPPAELPQTAATDAAVDAPSPATIEAPQFQVLPGAGSKLDDSRPSEEPPPLVATPAGNAAVDPPAGAAVVQPAEHSAYATSAAPGASNSSGASTSSSANVTSDDLPNLQSNPWYRPERTGGQRVTAGANPSPESSARLTRANFTQSWATAREAVEEGKFPAALAELTQYYNHPDLSETEQTQLQKTLDSLAGRVIYSSEPYLAEPYKVRAGETLMDIAARHNLQWQLLQNINGVRDPYVLLPNTELKVMQGPFRAEVDLQTSHLTLFVDKYYAGRFPVSIGREPQPAPGTYTVRDKREGKDYYPADGRTIPAGHPSNPYGGHWLDLGSEICIHGSAGKDVSPDWGCISLSPIDAADVYGILTPGATVTVRR